MPEWIEGTLEGFEYKYAKMPDDTRVIEDSYGNDKYEFTEKAWWAMWDYWFHGHSGLNEVEFVVMLMRSGLIFHILNREYINGYHHQRFWSKDEETV